MLSEMTPRQFEEWYAAYNAGLFRDQWEQTGIVAAAVHNGFGAIRKGLNDNSITDDYWLSPGDYDPTREKKSKSATNGKVDDASIARAQHKAKQSYGHSSGNR